MVVTAGHCIAEGGARSHGLDGVCNGDLFFEWEEVLVQTAFKRRASCTRVIFREVSLQRDFALVEVYPIPPRGPDG